MHKYRIYELAKIYGKTSEEVIGILKKHQYEVSKAANSVDEKAKAVLDRELGAKDGKKAAKKPAFRTVRFDSKGRPQDGKGQGGFSSSYSTDQAEQEASAARAQAAKKEAAPAPAARPAESKKPAHGEERGAQRPQERRQDGHGARNDRPQRNGDRPQRPQGQRQDNRSASGSRPVRGGDRPQRSGDRPKAGFTPNRAKPAQAAPAPVQETRRDAKPAKKSKKDYERSRREKEGTSLMAQSMKQNKKKKHISEKKAASYPTEVTLPPSTTVKELAELFGREVSEIIMHLMKLGIMATINQNVDPDAAALLADDFGITLLEPEKTVDPTEYVPAPDDPRFLKPRPPVVTIMGHVDHGKTTLLDALRETNVAAHEAGGITQRIGAYQIRYKNQKITFLDTPGHEAFTAMRNRGAQITDIAVIIVAADDGVMPQTIEAINHAKSAKVPILVAINKIDKPGANPDHIKEELSHQGLISEDWGGDVIMVPISAKKRIGLDDLLDNILLLAEMEELKANPRREAYGVVVEAQLDKGRGPVMNVLVQNGTLHVGDGILAGKCWGRVRAMANENGRKLKSAEPSAPAEILGMSSVPEAGDHFLCDG